MLSPALAYKTIKKYSFLITSGCVESLLQGSLKFFFFEERIMLQEKGNILIFFFFLSHSTACKIL